MNGEVGKRVARLALQLAAAPAGRDQDPNVLDAIEQLARDVLKEVSAARKGDSYGVGETTGRWRAVRPRRQR